MTQTQHTATPSAAPASGSAVVVSPTFVQTAGGGNQSPLDLWQQITEEEARVVYEMTLRNELSGGTPTVREFEKAWREFTGLKYSLTTVNGTSALFSAFFGLGIGPGDEVICPAYTWICTISPVPFLGATPVFCESDPQTLLIDAADVRKRITPRTKAIVVVHLWGHVADMDAIMAVSRETGVPVVEDCSHAHGAIYKGRPVGSIGHVGAWSLQGSKPVSAGEGGVLATNVTDVFERACLAGQVNRIVGVDLQTPNYAKFQPYGTGMKFRAHPLGIGIALVQLRKLAALNERRRRYVETVEAAIREIPGLRPVPTAPGSQRGGYYAFPVHYEPEAFGGRTAIEFAKAVSDRGIPVITPVYGLLHEFAYFAEGFDLFTRGRGPLCPGQGWKGHKLGDFPVTEKMHRRHIMLPMLSDPAPGAVERVIAALRETANAMRSTKR